MLFSFPVFAEPQFYDISAHEEYAHKLEKNSLKNIQMVILEQKNIIKKLQSLYLNLFKKNKKTDKSGLKPLYH